MLPRISAISRSISALVLRMLASSSCICCLVSARSSSASISNWIVEMVRRSLAYHFPAVRAACGNFSGPKTIKAITPNKNNSEKPISNIMVKHHYLKQFKNDSGKLLMLYLALIIDRSRANFDIINLSA